MGARRVRDHPLLEDGIYDKTPPVYGLKMLNLVFWFYIKYFLSLTECTEKSLILDVFSLDGDFIGRETIHYIDKIQLLTSLLLQEENPARLVCQLFPAQLVSRDQLDVAFSDWLNTIQTAYCKVPGESEESYSDLPENYVRPDNLLPSELSLYLDKLQISDSFETVHRRTSSSSCPEMRKKHSLLTEVRDRCSSYPLSTERSTYENQGEEVYTTTTCCSLCRADRKGHSLLTQSRKNVCCERYGACLEEYSYCRPLPEMYPNAQHKLDYVQENCSHDASETQVQRRFGVERRNDRYREEIRTRRTQHVYETLESLSHCPPPLPPPRQQASPKYDRDLITSNGKQEKSSQRQHELRTVAGTSESSGSNNKVPGNKILNLKPQETFNKTVLPDSPKTKSQPRVGKLSIPASLQLLKSSLQSRNEPKNLAKRDARNPASHTENSSQSSRNLEQARIVYAYKPPPPLPTGGRSKSYSESYSQKECDALNMMKSRSYSTGATPTERDALFGPPTSTDSPAYKAGASNDHRDDDLKAEYSLPITFDFDFIRNGG
ncbi:hypothetical protein PoB_000287900 [Plakobranchus ocellatus]|uniref:Spermatogenesis-associated protein 6 N-terminal domain-containing protein n=1 Tax=Plakobranchus ocellatus TaxID=259542 RepID=A0AAV3Y2X1_9GAST|nr:hypothetical protein PoB_000287900 [Plakobranchus ocellatus]